ncbi:hypothetical protein CCACVL1_28784 [Corchorus capsularis]|uniref:Uncharacterized protein n=1 Tax=Corchorus capsularis TaxID=210143 RepID=A0A1R3G579_COCAP|nr:hypothetical protein CCACVL1_28784 [Corchorus capsularis]
MACSGFHREGSRSVPSKSVTCGGGQHHQHMDSMVVQGKRVAHALTYEDISCEILSKMGERAVARGPSLEENRGVAANRVEGRSGYHGDDSYTVRNGNVRRGRCAPTASHGFSGEESSGETPILPAKEAEDSSASNSSSNNHRSNSNFLGRASTQIIPRIGPSGLSPNLVGGVELGHQVIGATAGSNMGWDKKATRVQQDGTKLNNQTRLGGMEEENNEEVIRVWEIKEDRIGNMQKQMSEAPRLLSKAAGKSSCCIFRVPQSLVEINGKCYQPRIVSIGPFHRGQAHLKMIEEHKWRYLASLLARIQTKGLGLEDLLKAIHPLETKARECYSEAINLNTDDFIEMMVVDGCFILELFRKVGKLVKSEPDDPDPLFSMAWILAFFYRDFLRLENQIPYFVLQCLFDLTRMPGEPEPGKAAESFLMVKFFKHGGVIEMPTITIDDFMSSFLTNCVAYEQCHATCSKHLTTYVTLLDCLINTYKDVDYLLDRNILENYFGTDADVARFINNLGKDIAFDIHLSYLATLFNDVNQYYKNSWHVQWASFKFTYFNTPWSFLSALAALILLLHLGTDLLYHLFRL